MGLQLHMVMLDDYAGDPGEMFLHYGQALSWGVGDARFVAEFTGLMVVTSYRSGVRFGEETNLTLCRTAGTIYGQGEQVVVDQELEVSLAQRRVVRVEADGRGGTTFGVSMV